MERSSVLAGNPAAPARRPMAMTMATARWVAAGLLVAGVAAGCGGGGSSAPTAGESRGGAGAGAAKDRSTASAAPGGGEPAVPPAPLALAADPAAVRPAARDVVRTGTVSIRVDDVDATAARARRLAADAGGFVADEDADAEHHQVALTLRVPAGRFEAVRADVAGLGEVVSQKVAVEDVTARVVDVDSRVRSLRASVARVRGLLAGSGDVAQLAAVEGELARREAELESLEARQRVLRDQVALGTLRVHLSRQAEPRPVEGVPGFGQAVHRGWVALVDVARVAVAGVGYALPFAVPATLAVLAILYWRRRARHARPAKAPG